MADLKISQLNAATALAGTEVVPVVQSGATKKATIDQILTPAAGKGVDFSANTPTAGSTSQLLDWYEEGSWTPNQGSGLTVTGAFSSSGTYTRVGRLVTVTGNVTGATSIACSAAGTICSNLPFNTNAKAFNGSLGVSNANQSSTVVVYALDVYCSSAIVGTSTTIGFTVTYEV